MERTGLALESNGRSTDAALIAAVRAGSSTALATLYTRHGRMVYAVARRFLGETDAEDVMQDVFVGLPEALEGYRERGTFPAWLRRVAVRASLMALRRRSRSAVLARNATGWPVATGRSTEDRLAAREAIDRLPDSLRAVFVLREVEGYSHAEIAAQLGITRTASMIRHHRAWTQLRRSV